MTTRGDQIATAQGAAQVKALFGTIDTPEEALYLAQVSGYTVTCTDAPLAQYRTEGSGYRLVVQKRDGTCDDGITQVVLLVGSDGTLQELSSVRVRQPQPCSIGRRPQGLEPVARASSASSLGDFFAQAAHLEAASVHAFRYLHEELTELGAPEALLARVEQARRDEVRHARTTARLARRFGASVARARVRPRAPRSILEMALENATEGCVGETYGAVVASYQALTAEDAEVRAAMLRIAQDETAHAQLSWDLLAFYAERLTPEECAEVEAARVRALASLRHDLAVEPTLALRAAAGLPPAAVAQRLLDETHALLAA
ncbi:MAG: ferritin-like domain-containing protein [Polyangiaceae bacterium]|nr:ferritin-like domain-containing protein [Polyangiaceae bacterium]